MNNQSEHINELATALAKAQGEINPAIKDSKNPFYNSSYADLNSVWNSCRESLSKNNLAVIQTVESVGEKMNLLTTLTHGSGQWIRSSIPIIMTQADTEIDKYGKEKKINKIQVLGSTLTYLRRYSLAAIVGISTDEDDDGNSFSPQQKENYNKKPESQNLPKSAKLLDEPLVIPTEEKPSAVNLLAEKPIKYINKAQIKMYNEKYDQVDDKTREVIDAAVKDLEIQDLTMMPEKNWMKFMKAFENYFEKKKNENKGG